MYCFTMNIHTQKYCMVNTLNFKTFTSINRTFRGVVPTEVYHIIRHRLVPRLKRYKIEGKSFKNERFYNKVKNECKIYSFFVFFALSG